MSDQKTTRQQLSTFIKDARTLRAFEQISTAVQQTLPSNFDESLLSSQQAEALAKSALNESIRLNDIARSSRVLLWLSM